MSLTLFPHRPNTHPHSPYPRSPGEALSPRSMWPPAMYRQPPPRVNTKSDLPRDPSGWLDADLISYVKSHYFDSESASAVTFIHDHRLTPPALWFLQTDHDALSVLTTEDSLRAFILSLAQSIKPAVSPTTPRVKHVRRLSEDFAHPPPPPTPPPPSPSLPEESEPEEDDDVAESVISDWALDGDNDEIHEEAEAPPADATRAEATPEPAAIHHADAATGENTLGLDIGGEPTQPCEPVEPPSAPEPALSTASAEESFVDFEDARETVSRAPSEPPSGTQHADADTVEEPSADPQATEEPAVAHHEEAGGVAPSAREPEATEELPSGASNCADPPAGQHASDGAETSGIPAADPFEDDLGDPWAQHDEVETTTELQASETPTAPEGSLLQDRRDTEAQREGETGEPLAPVEPDALTSPSTTGDDATESRGLNTPGEVIEGEANGESSHAPFVESGESKPVETEGKHLPTPPESPEDVSTTNLPLLLPSIEESVVSSAEAPLPPPSNDERGSVSRDDDSQAASNIDHETSQQDRESTCQESSIVQRSNDDSPASEHERNVSLEQQPLQSPPSSALDPERRPDELSQLSSESKHEDEVGFDETGLLASTAASPNRTNEKRTQKSSRAEKRKQRTVKKSAKKARVTAGVAGDNNKEVGEGEGAPDDGTQAELDEPTEVEPDSRQEPSGDAEELEKRGDVVQPPVLPTPPPGPDQPGDILSDQIHNVPSPKPPEEEGNAEGQIATDKAALSTPSGTTLQNVEESLASPTVTLASGAEVMLVGRDMGHDDEPDVPGQPRASSSPPPVSSRRQGTSPSSSTDINRHTGPAPWPSSPGASALSRTSRSPPRLDTNVSSLPVSHRSVDTPSRSTVFSPLRRMSNHTPPPSASASKGPAWGFSPRNIFSSVTSFAFSSPTSESSPSTTRDSSQERQQHHSRITSRPNPHPHARPMSQSAGEPDRSMISGKGSEFHSTTSVAVRQPSHERHSPSVGGGESTVHEELQTAMSDSLLEGGAPVHSDKLAPREVDRVSAREPSSHELSTGDHAGTEDADAEGYVEIRADDLTGENGASASVECGPETETKTKGEEGAASSPAGTSSRKVQDSVEPKQAGDEDVNEDVPLALVARSIVEHHSSQGHQSGMPDQVAQSLEETGGTAEQSRIRRGLPLHMQTDLDEESEGPESPSVDASDNPGMDYESVIPGYASMNKNQKKQAKKRIRKQTKSGGS